MNVKNNVFIVPILFILIIVSFFYIDFYFPVKRVDKEKFSSFYNVVKGYSGLRGSTNETRNLLECKSGKIYYVINNSAFSEKLKVGQKIQIEKTFFLGKPKLVRFIENKKQFEVSILSESFVNIVFICSIVIAVLNLLFENKFLEILLSFVTAFVFFTSLVYLFYF